MESSQWNQSYLEVIFPHMDPRALVLHAHPTSYYKAAFLKFSVCYCIASWPISYVFPWFLDSMGLKSNENLFQLYNIKS